MKDSNASDELVISYLFPPSKDVAGMVLAKRYMLSEKRFDVIQADVKKNRDDDFKRCVDEYINDQILIDINCNSSFPDCIFEFIDKSMAELDARKTYKRISTRVWKLANNFLALEYKLKHPEVYWTAEFSDPLLYDIYNNRRDEDKKKDIHNQEYIDKLNSAIDKFNKTNATDFKLLDTPSNVHFLVEYIAYIFADKIIFTNENQREIMLDQFPLDVKDFVIQKSEIKPQPVLPEKYYHVKECDVDLDSNKINIGYFGNIYSKRHFEMVFYAFETLNHKFKDRLKFHFYINDDDLFKQLTANLEILDNIQINETIDYLYFLNTTTKLDVLIINDLITGDCFDINPYRPSKLSDYQGSGSDIWAICEKGSILENTDVKYKSYIDEFESNTDVLVSILADYGYGDDDFTTSDSEKYFLKRLTDLNVILDNSYKKSKNTDSKMRKLKRQNSKLKKEISKPNDKKEEPPSSKGLKITEKFRRAVKKNK